LADDATSLLANHLAPGPIFAQDQVGALSPDLAVGAGSALALWDKTPLEEIRLSVLERICNLGQAARAVHLLNRKIRVKVDPRYVLPVASCLFRSTSRLDFFAAVPSFPGLSVILPPTDIQPPLWWNFKLDFRSPHRAFHYKHGKLGFHPDHATCYIGSSDSLDMWVIFVPDEKLDEDANTLPAGSTFSNPTQLSSKHLRQFLSWIVYCLSLIHYPGIHLQSSRQYSINLDHNPPDWSFVTGFKYVSSLLCRFTTYACSLLDRLLKQFNLIISKPGHFMQSSLAIPIVPGSVPHLLLGAIHFSTLVYLSCHCKSLWSG
jgi:hypothetical protein